MKIVLVRPKYNSHIITPPLGLGYLSSYLQKHGIQTRIIDALRDKIGTGELAQRVIAEKPDLVGVTCLTAFYNEVMALSRTLKQHGIPCVIGGVHPTFLTYQTLVDSGADYAVCGEGELALLELATHVHDNGSSRIQGVYSKEDLENAQTSLRKAKIAEDLDSLPFPDWEQMDPNLYAKAPHGAVARNLPVGVVVTSRGCPYQCTFCASPGFHDRRIRFRSPENVVEDIGYLVDRFRVREIHFEDDNLTLKRDHIERICNLLIKNKIKISWACPNGVRADKVDKELLMLMKESGCYHLAYGIESTNAEILRNIKKMETIDRIAESIRVAEKLGISSQGFFILGLPGETAETIEANIQFALKSGLSRAQFVILDVLPGSELWSDLRGRFSPNWGKNSFKEPEFIPEGLSREQLMKAQATAFRRFYLRPRIVFKMARAIRLKQVPYILQRLMEYRLLPSARKSGPPSKAVPGKS